MSNVEEKEHECGCNSEQGCCSQETSQDCECQEEVVQLTREEELENQVEELENARLRVLAEYDNYKRRTSIDLQNASVNSKAQIIEQIIPALDNFEMALKVEASEEQANFLKGFEMVYENLKMILSDNEVEIIDQVGVNNDPTVHMAIELVDSEEFASDQVVEIMQKGYKLKGKLIRPAMVRVAK